MRALEFIKYRVGEQSSMSMWHDPWLRGKSVLHLLGSNIISLAESSNSALVGEYLTGRDRRVGNFHRTLMRDLRHLMSTISIISRDEILWDDYKVIKLSDIWHSIRLRRENIK